MDAIEKKPQNVNSYGISIDKSNDLVFGEDLSPQLIKSTRNKQTKKNALLPDISISDV